MRPKLNSENWISLDDLISGSGFLGVTEVGIASTRPGKGPGGRCQDTTLRLVGLGFGRCGIYLPRTLSRARKMTVPMVIAGQVKHI